METVLPPPPPPPRPRPRPPRRPLPKPDVARWKPRVKATAEREPFLASPTLQDTAGHDHTLQAITKPSPPRGQANCFS